MFFVMQKKHEREARAGRGCAADGHAIVQGQERSEGLSVQQKPFQLLWRMDQCDGAGFN